MDVNSCYHVGVVSYLIHVVLNLSKHGYDPCINRVEISKHGYDPFINRVEPFYIKINLKYNEYVNIILENRS